MLRYFMEYPDDWIGIPDFGEGLEFATAEVWADAVAQVLTADLGLFGRRKERRAALAEAIALISHGILDGGASTGYIHLETLDGPIRFVALTGLDREEIGDASGADLARLGEEGDFVPPIVRDFTTDAADSGVYVERHGPLDSDAPHVAVISGTYAFELPEGVILLQSSTTDLPGYARFRPAYEALARTFHWDRA